MTDRCPSPEEIASLASVARGDPRRAHVESCPRCQAILLSYEEFMAPDEPPPEAHAADASAELESVLRREVLGPTIRHERKMGTRDRLRCFFRVPVLAPAAAVVAIALIVIAVVENGRGGADLRGPAPAPAAPVVAEMGTDGDGARVLTWQPPAGCNRSVVVLYAADLSEISRQDVATARSLSLPRAHEARYWRVLCLRGNEEVSRSMLQELGGGAGISASPR